MSGFTISEVRDELTSLVTPFVKGYNEGSGPNFKKKITGAEAHQLLTSITTLIEELSE